MAIHELKFDNSFKRYNYSFSGPRNSYLTKLRKKYKLDKVVSGSKDDLDTAIRLCKWTHGRWKHDGRNNPGNVDPIWLLERAVEGERFRCVEYAVVLKACLLAMGIKARILSLRVKNIETIRHSGGHLVVEAYLDDYGKWVMLDPQWAAVPLIGKTPLNTVEFQQAITKNDKSLKVAGFSKKEKADYIEWMYRYLFFFISHFEHKYPITQISKRTYPTGLFLAPLGYGKTKRFQRLDESNSMKLLALTHSLRTFYQEP